MVWQLSSSLEREHEVTEEVGSQVRLCGTVEGHRVVLPTVIHCSYAADGCFPHAQDGHWVGNHTVLHASVPQADPVELTCLPAPHPSGAYPASYESPVEHLLPTPPALDFTLCRCSPEKTVASLP